MEKNIDPKLDTSLPGREEEVIDNTNEELPRTESIKDELTKNDTTNITAEKTFEEGLQNNNDTSTPLST